MSIKVNVFQGVPSREELFNSPEMLDYLNKLNRKRNVQDYKEYRQDKIREYRNQNYKGPMKETEDGTPYPDRESPEWKEFQKSEEFQKFINSYPNPDYDHDRFQFPNDFKQKDYYPQEGDWDEKSKEEYNRLFNPEPDRYEQRGINMDIYIEQHPELRQQLEELREQQKWEEEDELQKQIYESIPEEEKNRKPSPQDLRKERYNDWCPCYKTQEIIVQGQPVQHRICVPCEQAQVGGYVNMNTSNPLTRFIYGGNEPDYYEQDNLPEARDGVGTPPIMKYNEWFKDYTSQDNWPGAFAGNEPGDNTLSTDPNEATAYHQWMQEFNNPSPEAEEKRFDAYQNYLNFRNEAEEDEDEVGNLGYKVPVSGSNNTTTHNCPPGSVWVEKYQQCVPLMQIKYNPRIVAGDPGLHNILLPWNPIFKTRGYRTKYGDVLTLKDLQKYAGNPLGKPYASLEYRKHLLGPKRTLNIWNPDGKLSEADMKALMDYGLGSGWKQKGAKSKDNKSVENRSNNIKTKEEKTKREKKKDGPREVRFSTAALKYRLQQGQSLIDEFKDLGNIVKKLKK